MSLIQNGGLGHNWPAGAGTGGSYITANSIDYPHYLATYFFANNRRVDGDTPEDPGNGDDDDDNGNGDDFTCTETTSSTYAHVDAGRAYQSGGIAYAEGSGDDLGLWNTFNTVTLAETGEDFYQEGSCP